MKLLQFDIYGRLAHFRKFYSNVTSLSYYFPPRNTIIGMIGSILGMQRDSYYGILSDNKLGVAIRILEEPRKLLVSMDYLDLQSLDARSLRGMKGMKPTKIELILPAQGDEVGYRVFLASKNAESERLLMKLYSNLVSSKYVYPVSLGPAYCLAHIDEKSVSLKEEMNVEYSDGSVATKIGTVVPSVNVTKVEPKLMEGKRIMLEESLPPNFSEGRKILAGSRNYIFEAKGEDMLIFVKSEIFPVGDGSYGVFM
jgi:CRISPR-associated protein Cas5h